MLNIVLDPLFIFTLDMGAGGAALATAVSQVVSFVILLLFFLTGRSIVRLRLRSVSRHFRDYWLIFTTGLPTVCLQGLGSVASAVLNMQAVLYGDAAVSAITIANKLYVFVRNLVIGIGQGFQPVAGYNYSAGKRRRAWQAFWFSSLVGTVLCTVCAIVMAIFARPILWWFCSDAEVVRIGADTLRFSCIVLPLLAVSTFVNQLYQCLGYRTAATFLASCRQGHFLPSGRAAPAVVAALRRCGDEPARGRPSDLRDLHAVPRSILPAPYPRACRVNSTKKFEAKSPEFFSRSSSIAYIMPDSKPFPRRAARGPFGR